ncbi:MAG: M24 family metallopeptidase [Bacteroidetes bacterium]|nr:MAG: M24 family metallopeptidase [Bacteroidota bacterium]
MKYHQLPSQLFKKNRSKFMSKMKSGALAVFNSNDIYPISADSTIPFQQHRDIFYLSGVDQEESMLVLFPDSSNPKHREVLFLKETSEHIAIWEGAKLTKEQAYELNGIETVYWLDQFETVFKQMMSEAEGVYLNTNEHLRASTEVETREDRFIRKCRNDYPAHQVHKSAPIMHLIRSIKEPEEIQLMKQACDITHLGVNRLLNFIKPGVWEYEIEAELAHEFLRNRSKGFAYTPIIASGKNACVLHYIENNQQCHDGDVILMDFGAEYANYSSDLTRCFPVNGKFTERQKAVYNSVLHVKKEAEKLLVPGTIMADYHREVGKLMESELLKLGLIDQTDIKNQNPDWPAYKKYFMHGTSHFIGLDTHDVGLWHEPIKAGMVFTCEPGIYIPDEKLGIRIEDDLVVQESGAALNLMAEIPIEVDEIEAAMNA